MNFPHSRLFTLALCGISLVTGPAYAKTESARPINFRRDVIPVLTKAGCNSGACHGSFQGRGGFRLSLLGFDPEMDYDALVRESHGRRVFPATPEQSLILLKPTAAMPHKGGKRLMPDSNSYRILRDWIAQGLPGPKAGDATIARLEVSSAEMVLQPNQQAKLQVSCIWSDGVKQDATPWALFESTSDRVAEVSAAGQIKALQPGRAAVTVRYLGQVAAVTLTVPYAGQKDAPATARVNFIDDLISAEWKKLGLVPAPPADDASFLRRVHLDLIGSLPTLEEIQRFMESRDPNKRAKLIDALLDRPEYVDLWSLKWSDLLRAHRRALGEKGLKSFNGWLRQGLRDNLPLDGLIRELLTARGNLYARGPVAYYFIDNNPEDLAETTAQILLGIRLQCAKCHHHPFEVWSQDDYYGMAAFFARVQRKDTKEEGQFGGSQAVSLEGDGFVRFPGTQRVVHPRVLGQEPIVAKPGADSRVELARWITAKDNPFFARNVVNRYWGYLFSRGLVEPIDDMRATNPPSHPALLDALAKDFVDHHFDLKHLLRTLCNSRVYQLASEIAPKRDEDGTFFTHFRPRRLQAEVLLDAINQSVGVDEKFTGAPPGTRAIALPDSSVVSYFLETFGRPLRTSTCECQRASQPDLRQALHLINSEALQAKLSAKEGRLPRLLAAKKADSEIVRELYLASVSRLPNAREEATIQKLLAAAPSRHEGLEDLLWTLLNCPEFVFNH